MHNTINLIAFPLRITKLIVSVLVAVALAGLVWTPSANSVTSSNPETVDAAAFGRVALGDVDKDGTPDIVLHTWGDNRGLTANGTLTWYRGPGWTKNVIRSGQNYFGDEIQLVDLDHDGDLDVVAPVGNDNRADLYWYENAGTGGSWKEHFIGMADTASEVKDVHVEDLDADGKLDIAVRTRTRAVIFYQNSGMGFELQFTNVPQREGSTLGDVDNDGKIDFILNGFWLKNPGGRSSNWMRYDIDPIWYSHGPVSPPNNESWRDFSVRVQFHDLNGDGRADIVFSHSEHHGFPVTWYESTNPLGGPTAWIKHEIAVVDYAHTLQVADFNCDGSPDILAGTTTWGNGGIYLFLNDGKGNFSTVKVGSEPIYVAAVGDIDGDGDPDFVSSRNWEIPPLMLWRNTTLPLSLDRWSYLTLDSARAPAALSSQGAFGLSFGDIDSDGDLDIASGPYVYHNPGGAMTAVPWQRLTLPANPATGRLVDAGIIFDAEGDGKHNDILAEDLPYLVWYSANDSLGNSWTAKVVGQAPATNHGNGRTVKLARFTPNGSLPDIVLSAGDGTYVLQVPANPQIDAWPLRRITPSAIGEQKGIGIGDINGDGNLDVVVARGEGLLQVDWWQNPGNTTSAWTQRTVGSTDAAAKMIETADVNGDGRLDVVVTEEVRTIARVYWFEAPADPVNGTWQRHTIGENFDELDSLDVADLDADGDPDIVVGEIFSNQRVVGFENLGSGANWIAHEVGRGHESHNGARLADLDHDGDLDLVSIAYFQYQYLHLWRNDALVRGSATTPPAITTEPKPQTALEGQTATFSAAATGDIPIAYQWQKNISNIAGATGSSYTTPVASLADSGSSFRVIVSNSAGQVTSQAAILTVVAASQFPNLITNPSFESGTAGWFFYTNGNGSFSTVSPAPDGAQAARITLTQLGSNTQFYQANIGLEAGKQYFLTFSAYSSTGHGVNIYLKKHGGAFTSYGLSYTASLSSSWQTYSIGFTASGFSGTVSDGRLYFWFPEQAASGDTYVLDNVTLRRVGSSVPPQITSHPQSQTIAAGQAVSFSCQASGIPVPTYQWQKNVVIIAGATSSTCAFTVQLGDNGMRFRCVASNSGGQATSNEATLTVTTTAPLITSNPQPQIVSAGQSATFSVAATGAAPIAYQWQKNISNIAGATGASYTTPVASLADSSSSFRVIVSNSAGQATSQAAILTVVAASQFPNLITNPSFESGTAGWFFYTNGNGSFSTVSPAPDGAKAARIALTQLGSNTQFYQANLGLEAGKQYLLTFSAYSSTGHGVNIYLKKHGGAFTSYGLSYTASLSSSWQTYSIGFTASGFSGTVSDGRLYFWFPEQAASGDTYFLDNVTLRRVGN